MTARIVLVATAIAIAGALQPAAAQPEVMRVGRRAWLGFSYDTEFTRRDGETRQTLVIREVVAESPAQRAGLEVGDTLVSINDLHATRQLLSSLAFSLEPGDSVRLVVRRDGREVELDVEAAEPPANYVRIGPDRGIIMFDDDSLRRRLRILIDSARIGLDSLRIPNIYIERGPGRLRIWGDSVRGGVIRLDSLLAGMDSLRHFHFRYDSAWRKQIDSLTEQWSDFGERMKLWSDSVWMDADSAFAFRFAPRAFRWESGGLRPLDPAPFVGITVWGARAVAGAELTELNPDLADYFGADEGVLVLRVADGTPADEAGLQAGDVIVSANGREVDSIRELRRAIADAPRDEPVALEVIRRRERIELRIPR